MPESLKAAALALTANAEARWSALVFGIFLLVYFVRKFLPKVWLAFETLSPFVVADPEPVLRQLHKAYQALPSILVGIVVPAVLTGGDWKAAGIGALLGLVPPLQHELAKWIKWLPYRGELGKEKPKDPKDPPSGSATKDPEPTRIRFQPPEPPPGGAAAIRRWAAACAYAVVFALSLGVGTACAPSVWDSQQRTLNAVVVVSNGVLLPALERAHTRALTSAAQAQPDQESAALAVAVATEKWAPVWQAYDAYVDAVRAWQVAIDTEGDVLSTGLAARSALCRLHVVARSLKAELPAPPAGTCP